MSGKAASSAGGDGTRERSPTYYVYYNQKRQQSISKASMSEPIPYATTPVTPVMPVTPTTTTTTALHHVQIVVPGDDNKGKEPLSSHYKKDAQLRRSEDDGDNATVDNEKHKHGAGKAWAFRQTLLDAIMRNEWIAVFRTGVRPFSEKRWPVVSNYVLLVMMFTILSGELLLSQMTSSEFVELDPFNVMLGPSLQILIQSGARFPPCMRPTAMMPASDRYVCLNTTVPLSPSGGDFPVRLLDPIFERASPITQSSSCSLQDICGMSGFVHTNAPDQTFRFFTPMFVHTGIVHFAINALAHWFLTLDMERVINPIRFAVLYILCGVFGNLMGANFAMPTNPFMGCSTAVFGILGCTLIDVIYMWRYVHQPFRHLIKVTMIIGCCFVLGLLPGVDNFSHMGGLLAGLMLGPTMLPAHPRSRREQWVIRIVCAFGIGLFIALTVLLWHAFFQGSDPGEMCVFCRNISCLPIGGFCD